MTNKEKMTSLLDAIRNMGYTVKNDVYGNSYFFFEDEEDSVCHFEIKEIPGFLFGIWSTCRFDPIEKQIKESETGTWADSLEIHSKSELVFFTQYKRDMDKFKPSRSGFVTGLYRQAWVESNNDDNDVKVKEEWNTFELEQILTFMKKHHIKSVEYASLQVRHVWDDDRSNFKLFRSFIHDWIYHWKSQLKKYIRLKYEIAISKRIAKKLTQSKVLLVDRCNNCFPRLELFIRRKHNVDMAIYEKEQYKLDKFYDKYIHRISITQLDIDILDENITEDDMEKDKKLSDRFEKIVESYKNKKFKDEIIIYDNMEVKK